MVKDKKENSRMEIENLKLPVNSIIFTVQGTISRLNKNPNACSGRSKQPSYACNIVKRKRQLIKEGYKFDPKTRESGRDSILTSQHNMSSKDRRYNT